jgi:transposase
VASDVVGAAGRAMLERLVAGQTDPALLAQRARGKMRRKIPELERALAGSVGPHQRFLVARQLAHIDYLDETIAEVSAEIARRLAPFEDAIALLDTIPGVGRETAEALLAQIGTDMSQFPSAAHLASWAGMCPGNHESAGQRKGGKTRKGRKRAAVAIGHAILLLAYQLLTRREPYDDSRLQQTRTPRLARAPRPAVARSGLRCHASTGQSGGLTARLAFSSQALTAISRGVTGA